MYVEQEMHNVEGDIIELIMMIMNMGEDGDV